MTELAYECHLSLSVEGWLQLRTPQGRTLSFPPTEVGTKLIVKVLQDAKRGWKREHAPRGYIRNFPTQHVIDRWLLEHRAEREATIRAEAEEKFMSLSTKLGISVEIKL